MLLIGVLYLYVVTLRDGKHKKKTSKSETSCTIEVWHWGPLVSHTVVKGKHIVYDKLFPYYTSHSHLQFSSVHVIKRSDTTDVAAMLSDMYHKDGTHYSTGLWEVREYTGGFRY